MYSVFIVDDEVIVREGIRSKIDWENTQFSFAGEAADGEIALSMIQDIKPDILITDIKMPFMDGLELSRMVKKLQPWVRIIILSGHDEFEYAKKAISIGVEDYILKPFTSENLLSSLNKIAVSLDKQKQQFTDISRMKSELESSTALIRDKLLTDIVLGTMNSADAVQKATELHINLIARYYIVLISEIHSEQNDSNSLLSAKSRLSSFVAREQACTGFFISPYRFVCILKSSSQEALEDDAYSLADSIQHEISKNTDFFVTTAIGSIADRTAFIAHSYSDAEFILKLCPFSGKNRIVGMADVQKTEKEKLSLPSNNDPLVERLKFASESEIDQIITQYINLLGGNSDHFSIIASYLLVDVIMAVSNLVEELGGNIREEMPELLTKGFVDKAVANQETFIKEIRIVLNNVLRYRDSHIQGKYGDVILKAKKFIEENYSNQDICLHSVAEAVHFSPNHFSTIFSQECGITFIEHLTNVRIEQAKKLLKNTSMRSADIAYEVGFNDPHYFSYIFKKTTGITPREYRNV